MQASLLYTAAESRALDAHAIDHCGISGFTLMQRAAQAAVRGARLRWPAAQRIVVLCGAGNNAGDGYLAACLLAAAGCRVEIRFLLAPEQLRADAATAARQALQAGIPCRPFAESPELEADLILDGLLGTGISRDVEGEWHRAIEAMNNTAAPVLALDVPSGLDADTGAVRGCAVRADATISFIARKRGLYTGAAPDHCGSLWFDDLDVPAEVFADVPAQPLPLLNARILQRLPPRARAAHKGRCGHVLVVGGAPGMAGAVRMAGEASARVGAGLVTVATHPAHAALISALRPELLSHPVEDVPALVALTERADWVALGPGLGTGAWGRALWRHLVDGELPLVVDADALNLLAEQPLRREDWILTPHPGEASRLLGCATADVERDRFAAVRALRERYGGTVVLKGAGTLIASGSGLSLCAAGNPGMASGGMGDVLTGVIAGLAAQQVKAADAAAMGVWMHADAADAAAVHGERGLLATDLFAGLRARVNAADPGGGACVN